MGREPSRAVGPQPPYAVRGAGVAVQIAQMMRDRAPAAVELLRRLFAGGQQHLVHKAEERFVTGAEPRDLGGPVVHLQVDVGVVIGVPRVFELFDPYALQVRGQRILSGGGDQQIFAEGEVERGESRVPGCRVVFQAIEPFVGGQSFHLGRA